MKKQIGLCATCAALTLLVAGTATAQGFGGRQVDDNSWTGTESLAIAEVLRIDTLSSEMTRVTVRRPNRSIAVVDFYAPAPVSGNGRVFPAPLSQDGALQMVALLEGFRMSASSFYPLQLRGCFRWRRGGNFYRAIRSTEASLEVVNPVVVSATFGIQGGLINLTLRDRGENWGELLLLRNRERTGFEVTTCKLLRTERTIRGEALRPMPIGQVVSLLHTILAPPQWIIFRELKGDYDGARVVHAGSYWSR